LVISRSLPSCCPAQRDARRRLPSRGSRGPAFPTCPGTLRREDCPWPVSGHFACRSRPDPLPVSGRSWCPSRARGLVETSQDYARAFDHPVPHSGHVTRRAVALPRSRATPLDACPALRPRWCPDCSPWRLQDCCLPATGNRRLSPRYRLEGYPLVHDATHGGAPARGLPPRALQLRTPIAGCARGGHF
jgi:hypothetical protein